MRGAARVVAIGIALAATPVSSQTIVDRSGEGIAVADKAAVLAKVTEGLADPLSAQIKLLGPIEVKAPGVIGYCGQINAKNLMGAYTGFAPFLFLKAEDGRSHVQVFDLLTLTMTSPGAELTAKLREAGCI